ncbi:MAG: hypothetical protein K1X83_08180 [Oligoflexia bacterium]|nr:hypothetical protein [Oligoflexia bacterium]
MRLKTFIAILAAVLFAAPVAFASGGSGHGGDDHSGHGRGDDDISVPDGSIVVQLGAIEAISDSQLVVAGTTFLIDDDTEIEGLNDQSAELADLVVGAYVKVKAIKQDDLSLLAREIDLEDEDGEDRDEDSSSGRGHSHNRTDDNIAQACIFPNLPLISKALEAELSRVLNSAGADTFRVKVKTKVKNRTPAVRNSGLVALGGVNVSFSAGVVDVSGAASQVECSGDLDLRITINQNGSTGGTQIVNKTIPIQGVFAGRQH